MWMLLNDSSRAGEFPCSHLVFPDGNAISKMFGRSCITRPTGRAFVLVHWAALDTLVLELIGMSASRADCKPWSAYRTRVYLCAAQNRPRLPGTFRAARPCRQVRPQGLVRAGFDR